MVSPMTSAASSPLLNAFDDQDKIFSAAFSILQRAIAHHDFPAASAAVTHRGRLIALKALGHFTYDQTFKDSSEKAGAPSFSRLWREGGDFGVQSPNAVPLLASSAGSENPQVYPSTLFDLASLTKVVATTPTAMILYERGMLDLDAPVAAVVPEFVTDEKKDPRRHDVALRHLLTHSSGLPAYEKLFLKARTRDELLRAAFTTPLTADPATRAVYSDIGFIILGIALERLADEPLDRYCHREVFAPLAMTNTTFNPPAECRPKIPPTADERESKEDRDDAGAFTRELFEPSQPSSVNSRSTFRKKIIQGEVQDENAFVLGGVAPQAGLFSTAQDLAKYAHALLSGGCAVFRPETIALFTRREAVPPVTSRALGWDTPSTPSQSGKYFSPQSYGHLGYTGTSLWIDPSRQLSVTLLTNRTWPDCSNHAIRIVRPMFHDAVLDALEAEG